MLFFCTGTIKVAEELSGSRGSVFFRVVATDLHPEDPKSGVADVEIIVVEVNRNPPIFEKGYYEAKVQEDALRYSRVMKVTANDADTGESCSVTAPVSKF